MRGNAIVVSPGRVTVVLRQESESAPPPQEDWFQFMLNARKKMEEVGSHFMGEKEVQAHSEWLREGGRFDDLLRAAEQRQQREQP